MIKSIMIKINNSSLNKIYLIMQKPLNNKLNILLIPII